MFSLNAAADNSGWVGRGWRGRASLVLIHSFMSKVNAGLTYHRHEALKVELDGNGCMFMLYSDAAPGRKRRRKDTHGRLRLLSSAWTRKLEAR